jgi:hypothetical protein
MLRCGQLEERDMLKGGDLTYLLCQAEKCRRLADLITDDFASNQLLALAGELECEARTLREPFPSPARASPPRSTDH